MTAWLKIGEFAKRTGLSRDTIRFYHRRGLLQPQVLPNGYHVYSADQIDRAIGIQVAQGLGFTLAEIAEVALEWQAKGLSRERRLEFLSKKAEELEARSQQLERMRHYLLEKANWIRKGEKGLPPDMRATLAGPKRKRPTEAKRRSAKE
jgi:MerR family transcriptional regulator, copper efflux regulator